MKGSIMSDTTFFRVDGFSAIRHDNETKKNLAILKSRNAGVSQSTIIRHAIVNYAQSFNYEGSNAVKAMEHISEFIKNALEEHGISSDMVSVSASNIIKFAIKNEAMQSS